MSTFSVVVSITYLVALLVYFGWSIRDMRAKEERSTLHSASHIKLPLVEVNVDTGEEKVIGEEERSVAHILQILLKHEGLTVRLTRETRDAKCLEAEAIMKKADDV